MGDATGPGTPGSSDAPGNCTPRCRRPPRARRTARQQAPTEMSETSYGTAQAGAQTLAASGLRDFRVPFIPGTTFSWAEALAVRLEFSMDRLWLVLEPTVLGSKPSEDHTIADRQRRKEFVRERLATRYNKKWNELLDAWISVLSGGSDRWIVTTFGLTQGVDASFEIH